MRAIPRAHPRYARALSVHPSPRHRGVCERKAKAKALVPAFAGTTRSFSLLASLLLLPGSLSAAARARRIKPVGARARGARVRCQARDGLSANLRSVLAKSRGRRPRDRGRVGRLSWVTFSGETEKVTRPPGRRTKPHTDVSRFSYERLENKRTSNSKARKIKSALTLPSPASGRGEKKVRALDARRLAVTASGSADTP
jgi:hypothetical protein